MEPHILISLNKISKNYIKNSQLFNVLNKISLNIYKGECLAIIGPSGSGKSTLCSIIQGITKQSSGNIFYNNNNNKNYFIQTIFQDIESSLNPRMNIKDILLEPLILLKQSKQSFKKKIEEILNFTNLSLDILPLFPHQISGGQKQRIAIAKTLLANPSLIICDESTSSLDPINQQKLLLLFKKIQLQFNVTFLFISHDLLAVQQIADRIAVLENGSLIEINNKQNLLKFPKENLTKNLISATKEFIIN